jgi:hypothetical protein
MQQAHSMVEPLEGRTMMSVSCPSDPSVVYVGGSLSITDGTSNTLLLPAVQKIREAAARIS